VGKNRENAIINAAKTKKSGHCYWYGKPLSRWVGLYMVKDALEDNGN
jgi:hypothetical protein